jgi:hypothetical protein
MNEPNKNLMLLEILGFVLKVSTHHYTEGGWSGKTRISKWVIFSFLVIFLFLQNQVPRCISTHSNGGSNDHHGF